MVKIKVDKPGTADGKLSDNQKLFRDQTAKPMGIPHYAVSARKPAELIPQLVKIIVWHMDKAGYDTRNVY